MEELGLLLYLCLREIGFASSLEVEGRALWAVEHWSKARRLKLQGIRGQCGPGKGTWSAAGVQLLGGWVGTLWESGCEFHSQQGELWEDSGQLGSLEAGGLPLLSMGDGVEGGLRTRESSRSQAEVLGWGPGWLLEGLLLVFSCSGRVRHYAIAQTCSMPGFPVLHYLLECAQSYIH